VADSAVLALGGKVDLTFKTEPNPIASFSRRAKDALTLSLPVLTPRSRLEILDSVLEDKTQPIEEKPFQP